MTGWAGRGGTGWAGRGAWVVGRETVATIPAQPVVLQLDAASAQERWWAAPHSGHATSRPGSTGSRHQPQSCSVTFAGRPGKGWRNPTGKGSGSPLGAGPRL